MNSKIKDILEWVYCIVIAIVIAILIKYFLCTPTIVQMDSMYPTLVQGDRLLLSRIPKTFHKEPKRFDIITFEAPTSASYETGDVDVSNPVAKYENEPTSWWKKFTYYVLEIGKKSYIKRVIGMPGDHVVIADGKVYINDEPLDESAYLDKSVVTNVFGPYYDVWVPNDCVFVMGDHRSVSADSRSFGCVPINKIESRVLFRFWPINKFGKIKKATLD
jgi:signal peptidase I